MHQFPQKRKHDELSKDVISAYIERLPKEILAYIFEYVVPYPAWRSLITCHYSPELSRVNKNWLKTYKKFFPRKKQEVLEFLVGKTLIAKLIKEHQTIEKAELVLKEKIKFDAIINCDWRWLNDSLIKGSASENHVEDIIRKLEKIIWNDIDPEEIIYDMNAGIERKAGYIGPTWRVKIAELKKLGMKNSEIKNCGALLIAIAYLKKYGIKHGGYSLLRVYAQGGFDKGVEFLIANGADVNRIDPDGNSPLQGAVEGESEDLMDFRECLEILLQYGAQFPNDEAEQEWLILDMFFHHELSEFIVEEIGINLLSKMLPGIFQQFIGDLQNCKVGNDQALQQRIDNCDNNLMLVEKFLKEMNLMLWKKNLNSEISDIRCFSKICEAETGSNNFKEIIARAEELANADIDFDIITDEQINLFEIRNLLISLLLQTNQRLVEDIQEFEAVLGPTI